MVRLLLRVIVIGAYLRREPQDHDLVSYNDRFLKLNAAQKRQIQRDRRRKFQGGTRTNWQDKAERDRKHKQAQMDPNRRDPYEFDLDVGNDSQFMNRRERQRQRDCLEYGGWACGWRGMDQSPIDGAYDFDKNHGRHYHNDPPFEDSWYD